MLAFFCLSRVITFSFSPLTSLLNEDSHFLGRSFPLWLDYSADLLVGMLLRIPVVWRTILNTVLSWLS